MTPRCPALRRSVAIDATTTLLARPWRTLASAVGVLVGVASGTVTLMLASSQGAQVDRNFDRQLAPLVVLEPGPLEPGTSPVGSSPAESLPRQLDEVGGRQVGGELSTWRRDVAISTSPEDRGRRVTVYGATVDALGAAGADDLMGSLSVLDDALPGPLAWIGEDLARDLAMPPPAAAGAVVVVDGAPLSVAGVITEGRRFPSLGRAVVVDPAVARRIWGDPEQERIIVHVRRGSAATVARHLVVGLDPSGQRPVLDVTPPDGAVTRRAVSQDLQRAGLTLSAVALAIGAFSVAGALTSSVIQRTREIGLRAALGWSPRRISLLIVTEAAALGVFAAIVGTAAGAAAATHLCARNGWPTVAPTQVTWLPPLIGIVAGGLGGLAPALRASRISPTEALRG